MCATKVCDQNCLNFRINRIPTISFVVKIYYFDNQDIAQSRYNIKEDFLIRDHFIIHSMTFMA